MNGGGDAGGGGGLAPRPSVHSRPLGLECVSERLRAPSTHRESPPQNDCRATAVQSILRWYPSAAARR